MAKLHPNQNIISRQNDITTHSDEQFYPHVNVWLLFDGSCRISGENSKMEEVHNHYADGNQQLLKMYPTFVLANTTNIHFLHIWCRFSFAFWWCTQHKCCHLLATYRNSTHGYSYLMYS